MTGQTKRKIKILNEIVKFIGKKKESVKVRKKLQIDYNYSYGTIINSIYPEIKAKGYDLKKCNIKKCWCFIKK